MIEYSTEVKDQPDEINTSAEEQLHVKVLYKLFFLFYITLMRHNNDFPPCCI